MYVYYCVRVPVSYLMGRTKVVLVAWWCSGARGRILITVHTCMDSSCDVRLMSCEILMPSVLKDYKKI